MSRETLQVSRQTLERLFAYLHYLRALGGGAGEEAPANVSATCIAEALGLGEVMVRKDLAAVSSGGRPKVGYVTADLIADIERFLGCSSPRGAVLVGVGNLGRALLSYRGFAAYGVRIVAAFDVDPELVLRGYRGREVLGLGQLGEVCRREQVGLGILTVPPDAAQSVCDRLVESGVSAIWNFAPTHLKVPQGVRVHNENMAASLALLYKSAPPACERKTTSRTFTEAGNTGERA